MNPQPSKSTTLWMGDLEPWMDESWLRQLWLSFGEVVSIKLIRDRNTGLNAGYCFVDFQSGAAAMRALSSLNGSPIPGTLRIFKLNWAAGAAPAIPIEYSIYVCDLPLTLNDYQLFAFFHARYPSCRGAKIVLDPLTHLSKGYGFVKFADDLEHQRAMLEMNGQHIVEGYPMRTAPAQTKIVGQATSNASSVYSPVYAMNYASGFMPGFQQQ